MIEQTQSDDIQFDLSIHDDVQFGEIRTGVIIPA